MFIVCVSIKLNTKKQLYMNIIFMNVEYLSILLLLLFFLVWRFILDIDFYFFFLKTILLSTLIRIYFKNNTF